MNKGDGRVCQNDADPCISLANLPRRLMSVSGQNARWITVRVMSAKCPNSEMLNARGGF
jgi:hypothetical protein